MANEFFLTEQELTVFGDVIASFHRTKDLGEMLGVIFTKIKPIFAIEGASIALHDPAAKQFYFYRTIEHESQPLQPQPPTFRFPATVNEVHVRRVGVPWLWLLLLVLLTLASFVQGLRLVAQLIRHCG